MIFFLFIDWQITGFKWSAIALAIAFTLCLLAAIAYRVLVQNKNDKKKKQALYGEDESLNRLEIDVMQKKIVYFLIYFVNKRNAPIQEEYTDEEGRDERYEANEDTDQDENYRPDEQAFYNEDDDYYE